MQVEQVQRGIGRAIASRRRARKLTQEGLAERVGSSPEWISQLERGVGAPSMPLLIRIADALGASPVDLVAAGLGQSEKVPEQLQLEALVDQLPPAALRVLVDLARSLGREFAASKPKGASQD